MTLNNYKITYLESYIDNLIKNMNNDNMKAYYKWFKQNARVYHVINKEKSKQYSKYSRIKMCYDNSYKIVSKRKTLKYIEGYTFAYGIPIEHAFITNNKSEIIDPTLAIPALGDSERYGSEYYGIEIPKNIIKSLREKDKFTPLPYKYWKYLQGDKNE